MKLCLVAALFSSVDAALTFKKAAAQEDQSPLRGQASFAALRRNVDGDVDSEDEKTEKKHAEGEVLFGDTRCPCIGFDNIKGSTDVDLPAVEGRWEKPLTVSYPADLGSRCKRWDENRHPSCKGPKDEQPGWCTQSWCLVDPCTCNIEVTPKRSVYMPTATYIGKPLFYSYATCGGKDMWTNPKLFGRVGRPKCQCMGFAGIPGSTAVSFQDGAVGTYPGDMGSSCKSWDQDHHPECKAKGKEAPSWCFSSWCYVDPCDCELPEGAVAKISAYLPEATFQGKNLYYSYDTCHSEDTWTDHHHHGACVKQETEADCTSNPRCAWTGEKCLGAELVHHPHCQKEREKAAKKEVEKKDAEEHSGANFLTLGATVLSVALASHA